MPPPRPRSGATSTWTPTTCCGPRPGRSRSGGCWSPRAPTRTRSRTTSSPAPSGASRGRARRASRRPPSGRCWTRGRSHGRSDRRISGRSTCCSRSRSTPIRPPGGSCTSSGSPQRRCSRRPAGGGGRQGTPPSDTPTVDEFGTDLTAMAREGRVDPVVGREDEIEQTVEVLSRRTKNNPVLIGEPGVGKTAIVEGIAQRIVDGDVPDTLRDKRLVAARPGRHGGRHPLPRRLRGAAEEGHRRDPRAQRRTDRLHR